MNWNKRPLSVTILGCLYIGVGTIGFAYHFTGFLAFQYDGVWVELIEILAILCGAFMLRGHNWARWVALAWIVGRGSGSRSPLEANGCFLIKAIKAG